MEQLFPGARITSGRSLIATSPRAATRVELSPGGSSGPRSLAAAAEHAPPSSGDVSPGRQRVDRLAAVAWRAMSAPRVVSVAPASPAERSGLQPGDEILALNGEVPRDVIAYRLLTDEAELLLEVSRGGLELQVEIEKRAGEPLGAEVSSALFDQVRTCDNHCEFCFIYQLPPGMRKSLYLKDDDYRLSFLYGNFTTLTRFTEADLERVVTERISPLHVSIHATDPEVRTEMLRNRRGATSLRWLRALLDHGIEVHGQIVVCPDRNDGAILDDTFAGVLDTYPELASLCVVPLGVSRFNTEPAMRPHTPSRGRGRGRRGARLAGPLPHGARASPRVRRRRVLPARRSAVPRTGGLRGLPDARGRRRDGPHLRARVHRRGRGGHGRGHRLLRLGRRRPARGLPGAAHRLGGPDPAGRSPVVRPGPPQARAPPRWHSRRGAAPRWPSSPAPTAPRCSVRSSPASVATTCGSSPSRTSSSVATPGSPVCSTGPISSRVLADQPAGHRYLLPDVCLSQGRFLDGTTPEELPRPVEVVPTDGIALRAALEER